MKKFLIVSLAALLCGPASALAQELAAQSTQKKTGASTPAQKPAQTRARATPQPAGLIEYGIEIAPDPRLAVMMAALDAAGWDPTPAGERPSVFRRLGFGWLGRHVYIVLPQAGRRLLPPLVSLLANVIQNTTLASLVGVTDILFAAKQQVERLAAPPPAGLLQQHGFAIYGAVLVFFFVISFPLTRLAAYLERRLV